MREDLGSGVEDCPCADGYQVRSLEAGGVGDKGCWVGVEGGFGRRRGRCS